MSCQHCGMPLTNSSGMASAGQSEQQELPAWLESLRAHERPLAGSAGDRQPFSMDELVDEDSMPHWMRQNQPRGDGGSSDSFPALSATASPEASPGQPTFPGNGLAASSLIEEQSLPAWMRGSQEGGQPAAGQSVSAQSLVDPQALPPWIKELGQTGPMATPPRPSQPLAHPGGEGYGLPPQAPVTPQAVSGPAPLPQTPPAYHELPTQGFSAHELVDQKELPGWMTGAPNAGQQAPNRPTPTGKGFAAGELIDQHSLPKWMQEQQGQMQSGLTPTGKGFAAGELIDQRSLPNWMQEQQGGGKSGPISAKGVPVNGSGQMMGMGQGMTAGAEGMPASMLVDANSLPPWMREEGARGAQAIPQPGGPPMAANSLIDEGALPQWIRNEEKLQQGTGAQNADPQNAGYARVEGMRVPSRPRTDTGTYEQSEAAANVFTSMLGVSASAPVMPGQEPISNLGVAQGQAIPPAPPLSQPLSPPVLSGWQSPQQSAAPYQGVPPQTWQRPGPISQAGMAPAPNARGQSGIQPPMYRAEQPVYTGPSANPAGVGSTVGVGGGRAGAGAQGADTKKKGFFDAIRDFFFK